MNEVKRYALFGDKDVDISPEESESGRWVHWDDYDKLKAERDEVVRDRNELYRLLRMEHGRCENILRCDACFILSRLSSNIHIFTG